MKRILTLALASCLTFSLGISAIAVEGSGNNSLDAMIESAAPVEETESSLLESTAVENDGSLPETTVAEDDGAIHIIVNDTVIPTDVPVQILDGVSYVPYWPVVKALYPDATAEWTNDRAMVTANGLNLEIRPGLTYFIANGRYLYLSQGIVLSGENLLLPVRPLCAALGAEVAWDPIGEDIVITSGDGPIASADVAYPEDVLYWLSHIINAEAGNQPLTGKIAVGNVVLNRVNSSLFPNTVYEVIYQRGQFTPVSNGSIKLTPNEESVIAAKLCLDGANTVGNALYFMNPRTSSSSWMARHRSYVTTIAQHAFYA